MKKQLILLLAVFLIFSTHSLAQNTAINNLKLEYDGYTLAISYDLNCKKQSDLFFIRVEITKHDGVPVKVSSFNGDVGDSIAPGKNKKIVWVPQDDAIFLDDTVTVQVKGERYERSFNKGSMLAMSTAFPGFGQTKISNGKPWWLTGVAAYGTLAGGIIVHSKYLKTYDSYRTALDQVERSDLSAQSQKQKNLSSTLFISAAAIWTGNIIWMAAMPNKYKSLQLPKLSFYPVPGNQGHVTMLSLKVEF